jgi:hypothetical protein
VVGAPRLGPGDQWIRTWKRNVGLQTWDIRIDKDWPIDKTPLKVEVETGTTLTATGQVDVLSADRWQLKRCEYDQIRRDLPPRDGKPRITEAEWAVAQQRCREIWQQAAEAPSTDPTSPASKPDPN